MVGLPENKRMVRFVGVVGKEKKNIQKKMLDESLTLSCYKKLESSLLEHAKSEDVVV